VLGKPKVNACVFCGSTSSKLTKEHWMKREYGDKLQKQSSLTMRHEHDGMTSTHTSPISEFDIQLRVVCRQCNAGWLNALEFAAETPRLSQSALSDFAVWAAGRALLRTCAEPWDKRAPDDLFHELYRDRKIPSRMNVLVGLTPTRMLHGGAYSWTDSGQNIGRATYLGATTFVVNGVVVQATMAGSDLAPQKVASDQISALFSRLGSGLVRLDGRHDGDVKRLRDLNKAEVISLTRWLPDYATANTAAGARKFANQSDPSGLHARPVER
jgi:hypothetical protein